MSECAVETCQRPAVVAVVRPSKNVPVDRASKWAVCQTCYMGILGFGPYRVMAAWEGATLVALVRREHPPAEDDRGPILQA